MKLIDYTLYLNEKRPSPKHIIKKQLKIKDKERTLKATREKTIVTDKGTPLGYQQISQWKPHRPGEDGMT